MARSLLLRTEPLLFFIQKELSKNELSHLRRRLRLRCEWNASLLLRILFLRAAINPFPTFWIDCRFFAMEALYIKVDQQQKLDVPFGITPLQFLQAEILCMMFLNFS